MTQTCVKHSCPDLFCRRSRVWWHQHGSSLTKASSAFWRAWVTGNEEAGGEEEERGGERSPCSAFSTSLLPLYITRMQIFKASRSERRESVEMVQGFKSWSSLCESQTVTPPSSPTFSPLSLSVWRSPGSTLCSDRCRICAFSVCFHCVLKGWGSELYLTAESNKALSLRAIYCNCLLSKGHWMSHWHEAERWAGFHWMACCRQPYVPPHFQYWPSCLLFIHRALTACSPLSAYSGCGCKKSKLESPCVLRRRCDLFSEHKGAVVPPCIIWILSHKQCCRSPHSGFHFLVADVFQTVFFFLRAFDVEKY